MIRHNTERQIILQHYEVELLMHQRWEDPRLAFRHTTGASSKEKVLFALSHSANIWKPDIYLIKHGAFKVGRTKVAILLRRKLLHLIRLN